MGSANYIGPNAIIMGNCSLGDNNWIGPSCIIGTPPDFQGKEIKLYGANKNDGKILIGSNNVIREFVTIHSPVEETTEIQDNTYIMTRSYVGHDVIVQSFSKFGPGAMAAGFVNIGRHTYLGLGSMVHQRVVVGAGSMVGMGSVLLAHTLPLFKVAGSPSMEIGRNSRKFNELGISEKFFNKNDKCFSWECANKSKTVPTKYKILIEDFFSLTTLDRHKGPKTIGNIIHYSNG